MKWIFSVLFFFATVVAYTVPYAPPIPFGSIVYPIVNGTQNYTFEFVSITSTPSSGGPVCATCKTSGCTNPCPSSASNPQNCQCLLPPNGYQWINNTSASEESSVSIRYKAYNSSGEYIGTFVMTIEMSYYTNPQITNEDGLSFTARYLYTSNNSTYSGPCWAIVQGPI